MFGCVATACLLVMSRQCIFGDTVYEGGRQVPSMTEANFKGAGEPDTVLICKTHHKQYYAPTDSKHDQVKHSAPPSCPYVMIFSNTPIPTWWSLATPGPVTRLAP